MKSRATPPGHEGVAPYQSATFGQQMQLYRERLLSLLLSLVGTLLPMLFGVYLWRFWHYPQLRLVYVGLLAASFLLGWGRFLIRVSYTWRVAMLLVLIQTMAVYAALYYGNLGEANLSFLFAIVVGGLFLTGWGILINTVWVVILHSLTTYLVLEKGVTLSQLANIPPFALQPEAQWLYTTIAFAIAGIGLLSLVYFIGKRFETTLEDTVQLTRILEYERQRLSDRERLLRRRVRQIRAASEIVNALGSLADPRDMMQQVVDQIQRQFGLYYVGIFLVDEAFEFAVLRAGSGTPGERMVAEGYRLPLGGTSMIAWAIAHREPRVALNVQKDPTHYENPYLPYTRSELALPLIARGEVLGAMTVQSDRPNAFDEEDIRTLQTLANSVALALSNALTVQRLQSQLREIESLQQRLLGRTWGELAEGIRVQRVAPLSGPGGADSDEEGVPLILPIRLYNQTIGEVRVLSPRPWQEGEADLLEGIVALLTNHLMVARLLDEVQNYARREEVQNRLAARFASALDFELLVRAALEGLSETFQVQEAWLVLESLGQPAQDAHAGSEDSPSAPAASSPGGKTA